MNNLCRFAVIALLLGIGVAWGDDADAPLANVPPPQPPFVARAPAQSSWLIVITPNDGTDHPSKSLKAQLWTKSGTAMQCANVWSDGTRTEDTVVGTTKFAQSPGGGGVHLLSPKLDPRYHDFSTGDFEMLDWITPEDYVGAVTHAGERCYLFRTKGSAGKANDAASGQHDQSLAEINTPASPTSAYISIRTGLPVAIENNDGEYRFQFGSPGELKLPDFQPPPAAPPPPPPPAPTKPKADKPPQASKPAKASNAGSTNAPSAKKSNL
jgi:hypothetical protein